MIIRVLLALIVGYFIGCFSTAYFVSKKIKGVDIRTIGSKNAGTTNVLRSLGFSSALITFIGDVLKGLLAAYLSKLLIGFDVPWALYIGGIAAVIGHILPITLAFRGGKGVAASLGVMIAIDPVLTLIFIVLFILANLIIKVYSITSIFGMLAAAVTFTLTANGNMARIVGIWILFLLILFTHRENIKRIFAGKEKGIDIFK